MEDVTTLKEITDIKGNPVSPSVAKIIREMDANLVAAGKKPEVKESEEKTA